MVGKSTRVPRFAATAFLFLLLAAGVTVLTTKLLQSPRERFERFVIRPIPQSVQNIKADRVQMASAVARVRGYRSRAFVLRFDISQEDFSRIVAARGFKPWANPTYKDGILRSFMSAKVGLSWMEVRWTDRQVPDWFDLATWTGFTTYVAGQDQMTLAWRDVSLLLYNEQLGAAYLIKWENGERGQGGKVGGRISTPGATQSSGE